MDERVVRWLGCALIFPGDPTGGTFATRRQRSSAFARDRIALERAKYPFGVVTERRGRRARETRRGELCRGGARAAAAAAADNEPTRQ